MNKGFSLVELILIIVILGILAISAIPTFTAVSDEAIIAAMEATIGNINDGLALYRANDMVNNGGDGLYPLKLDNVLANAPCSPASPCFVNVLHEGITDPRWKKKTETLYDFELPSGNILNITYSSLTGKFIKAP